MMNERPSPSLAAQDKKGRGGARQHKWLMKMGCKLDRKNWQHVWMRTTADASLFHPYFCARLMQAMQKLATGAMHKWKLLPWIEGGKKAGGRAGWQEQILIGKTF
jgi:hypothetical protein